VKFLKSVADHRRKDQIRNTKEDTHIPKNILTHNTKRRLNVGCPQLGGPNIFIKRTEQAKHGLMHEGVDDDDNDNGFSVVLAIFL
jgi:hypothetical protein